MTKKYWVQYHYQSKNWTTPDGWNVVSDFVTVGSGHEFLDLEQWWLGESSGNLQHELLQVVKL